MSPPLNPLSACQTRAFASVYAFPPQLMRMAVCVCAAAGQLPKTRNPITKQNFFTLPPRSFASRLPTVFVRAQRGGANSGGPLALTQPLYGLHRRATTVHRTQKRTSASTSSYLYERLHRCEPQSIRPARRLRTSFGKFLERIPAQRTQRKGFAGSLNQFDCAWLRDSADFG